MGFGYLRRRGSRPPSRSRAADSRSQRKLDPWATDGETGASVYVRSSKRNTRNPHAARSAFSSSPRRPPGRSLSIWLSLRQTRLRCASSQRGAGRFRARPCRSTSTSKAADYARARERLDRFEIAGQRDPAARLRARRHRPPLRRRRRGAARLASGAASPSSSRRASSARSSTCRSQSPAHSGSRRGSASTARRRPASSPTG